MFTKFLLKTTITANVFYYNTEDGSETTLYVHNNSSSPKFVYWRIVQ